MRFAFLCSSIRSTFTCAKLIVYFQSVCLQVLYLLASSLFDESFSHETECKLIVVCYSCLLLCLEQTLPFVWQSSMAWNMLHGLKSNERRNIKEVKTLKQSPRVKFIQWFILLVRQAVHPLYWHIDEAIFTQGSLSSVFWSFWRFFYVVFICRLVCSVMEL